MPANFPFLYFLVCLSLSLWYDAILCDDMKTRYFSSIENKSKNKNMRRKKIIFFFMITKREEKLFRFSRTAAAAAKKNISKILSSWFLWEMSGTFHKTEQNKKFFFFLPSLSRSYFIPEKEKKRRKDKL